VAINKVLELYEGFEPPLKSAISKVDWAQVNIREHLELDKVPAWTKGKTAAIGDVVHPFPLR